MASKARSMCVAASIVLVFSLVAFTSQALGHVIGQVHSSALLRVINEQFSVTEIGIGQNVTVALQIESLVNRNATVHPIPILQSSNGLPSNINDNLTSFLPSTDVWQVVRMSEEKIALSPGETKNFTYTLKVIKAGSYHIDSAFEYFLESANTSEKLGLVVSRGNNILAKDADDYPGSIEQSSPRAMIYDLDGNLIQNSPVGETVVMANNFTNSRQEAQEATFLFEVRDENGITQYLAWQKTIAQPHITQKASVPWTSDFPGNYQIRSFVISNFTNPQVLSYVMTVNWIVEESPDGSDAADSREIAVYKLLASDPRLAKYREGVYGHAEDFTPLRKEPNGAWVDEAIMHVIKQQIVEGDWQTGYNVTYKGWTDVRMEIRSGKEILSITEIPLAERTSSYIFENEDKETIRASLNNASVKQALESKEKLGYSTFVTDVAYNGFLTNSETLCPARECGRVHFQVEDTKQVMIVWLNTDTHIVGKIDLSTEWKQDCRQFACKES